MKLELRDLAVANSVRILFEATVVRQRADCAVCWLLVRAARPSAKVISLCGILKSRPI